MQLSPRAIDLLETTVFFTVVILACVFSFLVDQHERHNHAATLKEEREEREERAFVVVDPDVLVDFKSGQGNVLHVTRENYQRMLDAENPPTKTAQTK